MILYKKTMANYSKDRPSQNIQISIDELPEREVYTFRTPKERVKFIKMVESVCRKSMEYKEYIRFLKRNTDLRRCTVLKNLNTTNGKKYTIEVHHEPFTLFDITNIVVEKYIDSGYESAERLVLELIIPEIRKVQSDHGSKDYKTLLQEFYQKKTNDK